MKIPSVLAGVAGEYFVAAELSRRGHIASISLRNTRGIDIIATNKAASRSVTIQCKTNQLTRKVWILNEKSENFVSDAHFYVFVALGGVFGASQLSRCSEPRCCRAHERGAQAMVADARTRRTSAC